MPRKVPEMSALEVRRLIHPGQGRNATFAVGGVSGLYLQCTPNDAKSWIVRCMVGARRREIGLGAYPEVSLAQARQKAGEVRSQVADGVDPVEERKSKKAALIAAQERNLTFSDAADQYLETKLSEFRNEKHKRQWRSTIDRYALPVIGNLLVNDLTVRDMRRVLEPIWGTKTVTATRVRQRIEAILAWATVAGYREGENVARWGGNLDAIFPKPSKVQKPKHWPAVSLNDVERWYSTVSERKGIGARALQFAAMTAARSSEVRGAKWQEFDFELGIWIVPADRIKAGREHRVPLSSEQLEFLQDLPRFEGSDFVFSAARGGDLSDATLSKQMRTIHEIDADGGFFDPRG